MIVNQLMNREPLKVEESTCLREAIPLMSEKKSSFMIIVRQNRPVGIITERDVTELFSQIINDLSYSERKVADVMTPSPVCVNENDLFKDALMLSRTRKLRHLPVTDNNDKLVGVVTQANLVDAYVRLIELHDELENDIAELKLLSMEDPLLCIGNRRAMEVDLNHTEALSKRNVVSYSIALLDIDHFKLYNDHYGHQAGDEVLRKVAQRVKKTLRGTDRVYRYGGEELLVLIPDSEETRAEQCANRLRTAVESLKLEHCKSTHDYITVSIGVASDHASAWKDLVKKADAALYEAKNKGRNLVYVDKN